MAADLISSGVRELIGGFFAPSSFSGSILGSLFGGFRADGGPVAPNRAYMVGERGPEMFVPNAAGAIVPNHAIGNSSEVVVRLDVPQGVTVAETRQIAGDVAVQVVATNTRRMQRRDKTG